MMRVIIGMETSGATRRRMREAGYDAWSVDVLPSVDDSPFHIIGDVFDHLADGWGLGIFHPSCTYLTGSAAWAFGDGPYHQKVKPGTLVGQARREARERALCDVRRLMSAPIPRIAIENPVGAISGAIRKPCQTIQPYQFGDDASKRTCLWLKNLPHLTPTQYVAPRLVDGKPRWANQTDSGQNRLSPSADRWSQRSVTYPGIAAAMVDQWGEPRQMLLAAE